MNLIDTLEGVNGQLELYEDKVIIKRKGVLSKLTQGLFKGDKTIYLSQISGIQFKPGGWFANGYIQFTLSGGVESKKGLFDATQDENTVMFDRYANEKVTQMKQKIEELKSRPQAAVSVNASSEADELAKFKQLMDDGVITKEEFEQKKKQILGI